MATASSDTSKDDNQLMKDYKEPFNIWNQKYSAWKEEMENKCKVKGESKKETSDNKRNETHSELEEMEKKCEVKDESKMESSNIKADEENARELRYLIYRIMSSTRNYFCHFSSLTDKTTIYKMYSNIKNLYDNFGVDLEEKARQKKILDTDEKRKIENKYYYFAEEYTDFTNIPKTKELDRDRVNREIQRIIKDIHNCKDRQNIRDINLPFQIRIPSNESDEKMYKNYVVNETIFEVCLILFAKCVHDLVGTKDTNWRSITKYFEDYEICKNANNLKLKGKKCKSLEKLEQHWEEMSTKNKPREQERSINILAAARRDKTKDDNQLLKDTFNYLQPILIWNQTYSELKKEMDNNYTDELRYLIYRIMSSTSNYFGHFSSLTDKTPIYKMYSNMKNLYENFGVHLGMNECPKTLLDKDKIRKFENRYYYFADKCSNFTKVPETKDVGRDRVNREIQRIIKDIHDCEDGQNIRDINLKFQINISSNESDEKMYKDYVVNETIFEVCLILFATSVHESIGTRDSNWRSNTKYFEDYEICKDANNLKLKGKKGKSLEKLEKHWEEMSKENEPRKLERSINILATASSDTTKDDNKLMKDTFNYPQPILIWNQTYSELKKEMDNNCEVQHESKKETSNIETKEENNAREFRYLIYRIMSSTSEYFCHFSSLDGKSPNDKMYSNMKNLYENFGVYLEMNEGLKTKIGKIENRYYYFAGECTDLKNLPKTKELGRDRVNREIQRIIKDIHDCKDRQNIRDKNLSFQIRIPSNESDKEMYKDYVVNETIFEVCLILFAKSVHNSIGTRDTNNWQPITKYFEDYEICKVDDNLKLKEKNERKNNESWIKLETQWKQMSIKNKQK